MLVGTVTRVEDRQIHPAGVRETVCGARRGVAHDHRVRAHGLQRECGVLQ